MRKRFLLYAILFIILTLPIKGYAQSNEKIDALIQKGWVVGRGDEDYALDEKITRAEFTRMVVLLENKSFKASSTESPFLDVKSNAWFAPYIEEAAQKAWIFGDGDGKFRPNDEITYAEVFAILTRLEDRAIQKGKPWFENYVAYAEKWGYTRGIEIKDYRHKALRRHVFDGIYNVLESREKTEKSHESKTYPTLTFEFEKTEKTSEKQENTKLNEEKFHKIKLIDGDKIREINAPHGKTINKPDVKNRVGYNFVGWFNGEEIFDFETAITSDLSLTAKFNPKMYTVKFTDGETVNESKVTHGNPVTKPEDPVKEGYQFMGWFDGEKAFSFDKPITADVNLVAKFNPKMYTVKFTDGETVNESTVAHGKIVDKPDDPVKEGYTFIGWFNGEEAFNFETPITSDLSLTAKFEPKTYTVKFTDGETVNESTVAHGKIVDKPDDPVKDGYTFIGWFNGEESFDFVTPITSDINLVAKFEPRTYTVKFTEGETVNESKITHGKTVTKPEDPVKEGYQFIGWFHGENAFSFDKPITSDINLVAKFEPRTYTVKFTEGETVNESKVTHGKTVTKPEDPVKEGYQFMGWFDGEKAFSFDEPITADVNLVAKFEPKTYIVKFTDGETVNESKVTHGNTVTKPEDPVKEGYQFIGWFNGENAFSFDEPIISDISLVAKFVPEKVTVQIWDEEGKNLIKSETVHYGRFFHLPIIDKTGYRGVYESDDASYDMGSVIHPKQDISFRLRFIERVRIKYYVDDTGPTDLDKGPNHFGGHEAFVDKGSPISSIPKFAYVSTRYPLIRYDRENGRFDPEPFDLNTPITEPIDLVSISKGIHGGAIFLYVEPGGNPERLYHKIWVDKIEKIPEINLRAGGYHNDGWREADKAERYEFEGNFGNARGKVFVPYWVKDE